MQIKKSMINRQLRLRGIFLGWIYNLFLANEKRIQKIQKMQRLMTNILELKKQKGLVSEERYIARKDGTSLRVCVYTSPQTQPGAVGVLWIHGGGYAIGVPELDMQYYQKLLQTTNCVIISPDYTLSPSNPYPAALDDCYATHLYGTHTITPSPGKCT